jgi:hypothetical protein
MMRVLQILACALVLATGTSQASEQSDAIVAHLYAGTAAEGLAEAQDACDILRQDACFGLGVLKLVTAYEGLAQELYRYGAVMPNDGPASFLFGGDTSGPTAPANPSPEQLTYAALREVFDAFVLGLDDAKASFENAGAAGDYVVSIDPLKVRVDLDGDGKATKGETLGAILASVGEFADVPAPDGPPPNSKTKSKTQAATPDSTIGFDRADAIWFAGYTQVVAAPFDLLLAHDFSPFFAAYLHRVFPRAGLPMQEFSSGGTLFMDPRSDSWIADIVAGIHTLDFPVTDQPRLAGVLDRLKSITAYSRQNWELILAETDDNRELVPSPRQTSLVETMPVTQEIVDAWLATLDLVDQVLAGDLLVPHWRFKQGFDLKLYFETAERTDLVLLLTGSAAVPYLRDGPLADANRFSQANAALGYDWLNYAFWFN